MSDATSDAELAAAEAAVQQRLLTWNPDADAEAAALAAGNAARNRQLAKKRKRSASSGKKRQRITDFNGGDDDLHIEGAGDESFAPYASAAIAAAVAAAAETSAVALARTLILPRASSSTTKSIKPARKSMSGSGIIDSRLPMHRVVDADDASSRSAGVFRSNTIIAAAASDSADAAGAASASANTLKSVSSFVDEHRRDVSELGASALSKKDKRAYEARRRVEQGCLPLKEQTKPLPMLLGMRKKQRERDAIAKELALASGMLIRSKRRKK
jgi:Domain of unknown function (DUF4602)